MSGWDWLHAGLEGAIYLKARQARNDLNEMKTAAEQEVARRALLEAMKNLIFDISRDIQLAEEKLEQFPQQVYIVSRSLALRLADTGLSPELFPDFQDKEYVLGTEKKIASVVERAKAYLTPQQLRDSDQAARYIAEMPMLGQAIASRAAQESLRATDGQWKKASRRESRRKRFTVLSILSLVGSACVGVPLAFWGLSQLTSGDFGSILEGLVVLAFAATIIGGTIALFVLRGKTVPGYESLKANRERWQEQLLPDQDWRQITSTFGDLSSQQFVELRARRLAFLDPLLGGDFRKYLAPGDTAPGSA